jgi:cellulose synthase/poly-beta-1,6-N-acetylglucosamine synthase-like glycosyltransferase
MEMGCAVTLGGIPAIGRNAGARLAKHDYLVFADADVVFPKEVVARALLELQDAGVAAVHFRVDALGGGRFVRLSYSILAGYTRILNRLGIAQGVGSLIAVRKSAFEQIGGFREDLSAGEDADFLRRVGRVGRVIYEESLRVTVSPRRFRVENPVLFGAKTALWGLLRLLDLPLTLISYRWRRYSTAIAERDDRDAVPLMRRIGTE